MLLNINQKLSQKLTIESSLDQSGLAALSALLISVAGTLLVGASHRLSIPYHHVANISRDYYVQLLSTVVTALYMTCSKSVILREVDKLAKKQRTSPAPTAKYAKEHSTTESSLCPQSIISCLL